MVSEVKSRTFSKNTLPAEAHRSTVRRRRPPSLCDNNSLFAKPDFFVECSQLDTVMISHASCGRKVFSRLSWIARNMMPANWPCLALCLQLTGDHYVGKPSATGQPTRPTQPFILSGIDKWVAKRSLDEFYLTLVAPSGECWRGKAQLIRLYCVGGTLSLTQSINQTVSSTWRRCYCQPTFSGLNLLVAAVLHDSMCVCHCCPAWETVVCHVV